MDLFQSYNKEYGYNISPTAGSSLGFKHSEESKEKISNIKKNLYIKEKHPMLGKNHTIKSKEKMSKSKKGQNSGENSVFWGKHPSEEARRKMSESRTGEKNHRFGKPCPENVKKKVSEANKGKIISEEQRIKLSESLKGKYSGEKSFNTKLTNKDVIEIKLLLRKGVLFQREIAEKFNTTLNIVAHIKAGRSWSHIKLEDYIDKNGNLKEVI